MFQFNYNTQDGRAGEDEVRTASTLQPGAGRTRRNQGWMLHLLLSLSLSLTLFDLHLARLSLDAAHRESLRRALPWTRVRRSRTKPQLPKQDEPPMQNTSL